MRKIYIIGFLMMMAVTGRSQTVVIHEDVKDSISTKPEKWSSGVLYNATFYGGADQPGINGTIARSLGFDIFINIKYKPVKHLVIPMYLGFTSDAYGFGRSGVNTAFPDSSSAHSRHTFSSSGFALGGGARFAHRRFFLEVGLLGKWLPWREYSYQTSDGKNTLEVSIKRLDYMNRWRADAYARLGYSALALSAYYRLTDAFSANAGQPVVYELPRLRFGAGFLF